MITMPTTRLVWQPSGVLTLLSVLTLYPACYLALSLILRLSLAPNYCGSCTVVYPSKVISCLVLPIEGGLHLQHVPVSRFRLCLSTHPCVMSLSLSSAAAIAESTATPAPPH